VKKKERVLRDNALEIEAKLLTVVKIQLGAIGYPRWPFGGMGISLYIYMATLYHSHFMI